MTVDEALDVLAARLAAVDGLVVTTDPKATVVSHMAVVEDTSIDYNESFSPGSCLMEFAVTVYVSDADSKSGHNEARGYLSPNGAASVRAALEDVRGDALAKAVKLSTGVREITDNHILAVFAGSTHVPKD